MEPVLDVVRLFHLHDNLGARLAGGRVARSVDPLQLDLHLPPGSGTIALERVVSRPSRSDDAPLMMEIHPAHRPDQTALREAAVDGPSSRAERAFELPRSAPKPGAPRMAPDQLPYPARAVSHAARHSASS